VFTRLVLLWPRMQNTHIGCNTTMSMLQSRHAIAGQESTQRYIASQNLSLDSTVVFWLKYKQRGCNPTPRAILRIPRSYAPCANLACFRRRSEQTRHVPSPPQVGTSRRALRSPASCIASVSQAYLVGSKPSFAYASPSTGDHFWHCCQPKACEM
jgi:hypothetical protein